MQQIDLQNSATKRIHHLMQLRGFRSEQAMADAIGIPRSTLRSILERDAVGRKTAEKIANCFNISAAWVERGYGPPPGAQRDFEEAPSPGPAATSEACSIGSDVAKKHGAFSSSAAELQEQPLIALPIMEVDMQEFVFLQMAKARLSAGGGMIPKEGYLEEPYAFRVSWLKRAGTCIRNIVLMEVEGDSMSPTLQNGNAVLIDLGRREFKPGKLFAIGIREIVQIKRLDIVPPGHIRIYSDNPLYPTDEISPEELHIVGQLIWSARSWI